jgi:Co/Zn/Cd efflux system component
MYEHKKQPLASSGTYYRRILKNLVVAVGILMVCLLIGIIGYHFLANAPWIDAIHNAAMILSGMGPVIQIDTTAGKLFSSVYALFSGVIFIATIGFILAPAIHRLFHRLHLEEK